MPQLSLLGDAADAGCQFSVDYWANPLKPDALPNLTVTVRDMHSTPVMVLFARPPIEVLHELALDVMHACWEAWLFGTSQDIHHAFNATVAKWKKEATVRRKNAERAGVRLA